MYAISLHPEYVADILTGKKKSEYRTWTTDYRGDLLICSTQKKSTGLICGHALCVVSLDNIKPLTPTMYGWSLTDLRLIYPFKVRGRQRLFQVEDSLIQYIPESDYSINNQGIPMPTPEFYNKHYIPII